MSHARKTIRPEEMLGTTLCKCGHELGDHRANTDRECLHPDGCACQKFKAQKNQTPR